MPLDYTHQHLSSSIVKADDPHTPLDPNPGTDLSPLTWDAVAALLKAAADQSLNIFAGDRGSIGPGAMQLAAGNWDAELGPFGGYVALGNPQNDHDAPDSEIAGGYPATGGRGGDVKLVPTAGDGAGRSGLVRIIGAGLPTEDPGVGGALWVDGDGFVKISAG